MNATVNIIWNGLCDWDVKITSYRSSIEYDNFEEFLIYFEEFYSLKNDANVSCTFELTDFNMDVKKYKNAIKYYADIYSTYDCFRVDLQKFLISCGSTKFSKLGCSEELSFFKR